MSSPLRMATQPAYVDLLRLIRRQAWMLYGLFGGDCPVCKSPKNRNHLKDCELAEIVWATPSLKDLDAAILLAGRSAWIPAPEPPPNAEPVLVRHQDGTISVGSHNPARPSPWWSQAAALAQARHQQDRSYPLEDPGPITHWMPLPAFRGGDRMSKPTGVWKPTVYDRFDLAHGTLFVVTCGPEFNRQIGSVVELQGGMWEILGWDDHRMVGSPRDGENITIKVRSITWPPETCLAHLEREPCLTCAAYRAAGL